MKKNIVITGASAGFGHQLVTLLFENGFNLIGNRRYPEKHKGKVPFKLIHLNMLFK